MRKKDVKMLAILAIVVAIALLVVYLFTSYRGPDGLTFKEARMLEKYGDTEISKEELEESIDLDAYNEAIAFYNNEPSFTEEIKYLFASGGNKHNSSNNKKQPTSDSGKKNETSSGNTGSNSNTSGGETDGKMTYEKYISMSSEKQQKYYESFKDPKDFFKWYSDAKTAYDKKNEAIEVKGDSVDIGDYMD